MRARGVDERAAGLDAGRLDELVDGGGADGALDLLLDLLAEAGLDVRAKLVERVELARGARQLVVERRQHLLLELLDGELDRPGLVLGALEANLLALARGHPDAARARARATSRPAPSSTT